MNNRVSYSIKLQSLSTNKLSTLHKTLCLCLCTSVGEKSPGIGSSLHPVSRGSTKKSIFASLSPKVLVPITPSTTGNSYDETIRYSRTKVENFNLKLLNRVFYKENAKSFQAGENASYFMYSYGNKPTVYFSKKDGRIYGEQNSRETRNQARIVLRILNKFGLVEGYKRLQNHRENGRDLWSSAKKSGHYKIYPKKSKPLWHDLDKHPIEY